MHYEKEENKMIERYKQNEIDKLVQSNQRSNRYRFWYLC